MPGAPQAKFEFVATGDAAVNAQIEGVVNKLVRMKQQARDTQQGMTDGVEKTRATIHLLNDDLGLHLPRALQTVLAKLPALQTALSGLLGGAAIGVGAKVLVDIGSKVYDVYKEWTDVDAVVREYNKHLDDSITKTAQQASSIAESVSNLKQATDEVERFDRARLQASKESGNTSFFDDPRGFFLSMPNEKDAAKRQFQAQENQHTAEKANIKEEGALLEQLINKQKEVTDARLEGSAKILADERADNTLADAKLQTLQKLAAIENARRVAFNAEHIDQVPLIPADAGQLENQLAHFYNRQKAAAAIAKAIQDAQTDIQKFRDATADALAKATEETTDDPLQKNLTKVADHWNKIINEYERGSAEIIKTLKAKGIDTTALIVKENDTVLQLLAARGKAQADQEKKNQLDLLYGFGAIQAGPLPSFLFVSYEQKAQQQEADYLIKQINDDLAAEAAKEAELRDKAQATGQTQIDLETQLRDLRVSTADKTKLLVDQLMELAKAMHAGIGDPMIEAQAAKLESRLESLRTKTKTWQLELKQVLKNEFQDAFVGIVSGTETVSQAFKTMVQSILAELAKLIFQMYILKLAESITGLIHGGGATSAPQPGLNDAGFGGIIPHAAGGPVMSGMTYLVGERGPELLTVGASGYITPNSQIGGAMGKAPIVNIHNYGPPMDQQQTSHFDGEQFVIDVVVKNIDNNGAIRQKLR